MKYPNGKNKTITKVVNYANRGMNLEELLNNTNDYYLEKNKAVIYKKPTPIQIVETKYPSISLLLRAYRLKSKRLG